MKSFGKHLPHYLTLMGILMAGFVGLIIFSYNRTIQEASALATGGGYVAWGLVHHYLHKDLHFEVFLEYLAVAVLGLTIIFTLVIRS